MASHKPRKSTRPNFLAQIAPVFSFMPVIAGILSPMVVVLGAIIYLSYLIFGYPSSRWVFDYFYIFDAHTASLMKSVELLIFILGTGLFLYSLVYFAWKKIFSPGCIVSTNIYSFLRHPQNLATGVMLLPLSFMILGATYQTKNYIRVGDVLSWGLTVFFLRELSVLEEARMLKRHREKYWAYLQKSSTRVDPFFIRIRGALQHPYSEKGVRTYILLSAFFALFTFILFMGGCAAIYKGFQDSFVSIRMPPPFGGRDIPGLFGQTFSREQYVPIGILTWSGVLALFSSLCARIKDYYCGKNVNSDT